MTFYDITVKDGKGNDISLSEYKDKVVLIVQRRAADLPLSIAGCRICTTNIRMRDLKYWTFHAISSGTRLPAQMMKLRLSVPDALALPFLNLEKPM